MSPSIRKEIVSIRDVEPTNKELGIKQLILLITALALVMTTLSAQQFTQTIRGTITDQDSHSALIGATIVVVDSDPIIGSITDTEGNFRLTDVPIGRVTLKVSFVGYEERTIPNLLIGSAKEEILNITLKESINKLDEVIIQASENGEILNEMAIISAHTFSVEETQRYAGSFDDPARMVSAFAGVNGGVEGYNDIIVRGNSPKGVLWRLEGIAIPNPNHFAGEGTTGGPINALSSKMLSNSDFFTGAFAAEYGDVTSGVFDMKLKGGNNEKREYTAAISTLGLDMTAEGPFKKGNLGSYIANYRYSALDLLDRTGVVNFGGVPRYQDVSFKIQLPISSRHHLSLFGLGGLSRIDSDDNDAEDEDEITGKFSGQYKMGVFGMTHMYQVNDNTYIRSSIASTGSVNSYNSAIPDTSDQFYDIEDGRITKGSLVGAISFNHKFSAKHKIETGVILTHLFFDMRADEWDFDRDKMVNDLSDQGGFELLQGFVNWKYRITDNLTMVSGIHFLRLLLNGNEAVEPRLALKWDQDNNSSFNIGFGLHSRQEGASTYLANVLTTDSTFSQPNKDLKLMKAAHAVIGFDKKIGSNLHLKIEGYYQHLYDVPVDSSGTNSYSVLNKAEGYNGRGLVNEGTGRNYGLELTLERYFDQGIYYMSTLSLFRSFYTPLDGKERKSAFDNIYVANLIGGKEFNVGKSSKNKVFFLNTKMALIGGKRYSPIDLSASIVAGAEVIDEIEPYSQKGDDILRVDFSFGMRRNRKRTTTEFKFDFQNILNRQTVTGEEYIHATQAIQKSRQLGILPTISYKISF